MEKNETYKKTYNTQEWEVNCFLTTLYDNTSLKIPSELITYICIENTLEFFVPTLKIKFDDKKYEILNYLSKHRYSNFIEYYRTTTI